MPSISDYRAYSFDIPSIHLDFELEDDHFVVRSKFPVVRKPDAESNELFLNGEDLELLEVKLDDTPLNNNEYQLTEDGLTLLDVPEQATLEIHQKVELSPTAVMGLYRSDASLITQCEDEGFRRIAFFPDRPDVLSSYTVRIEADKGTYPTLLSNGNEVDRENIGEERHAVTFEDPFPKPCYLFALAAGPFAKLESTFRRSGNEGDVELTIYSSEESIRNCSYAMQYVKEAMNWDQAAYGLVYDLDRFSIVAVDKFQFGAMENKSLNVFNTLALHASKDVATDATFERVAGIVAHEYFHNYTGDRVTVRDWFQLSLKEGLTVFRDQSFTRDRIGYGLGRILDAQLLRDSQFPEAQSGLAHPVRPYSMEVPANYYTRTIYEGGAENCSMLSNLLGRQAWREALRHYLDKFDGQAVTIDDFVHAIAESSNQDLDQFKLWYSTSGTPRVTIRESRSGDELRLQLSQHIDLTADQEEKPVLSIPLSIGVVDTESNELLVNDGENSRTVSLSTELEFVSPENDGTIVLNLNSAEAEISIKGIEAGDQVSVLRNFSSPIEVDYRNENDEVDVKRLEQLAVHDTNGFAKFDAAQHLLVGAILDFEKFGESCLSVVGSNLELLKSEVLADSKVREIALSLTVPTESRVLDLHKGTQIEQILEGIEHLERAVGLAFASEIDELLEQFQVAGAYSPSQKQIATRSVRHTLYKYLFARKLSEVDATFASHLVASIRAADNLTDRLGYWGLLLRWKDIDDLQHEVMAELFELFKDEPLVVEKWIMMQIQAPVEGAEQRIAEIAKLGLLENPTPNRWRSTFWSYTNNWVNFHRADGSGYEYYTDRLLADASSLRGVVARGVQPLAYFHRMDGERKEHMVACLRRMQDELPEKLVETRDMVTRSLRVA